MHAKCTISHILLQAILLLSYLELLRQGNKQREGARHLKWPHCLQWPLSLFKPCHGTFAAGCNDKTRKATSNPQDSFVTGGSSNSLHAMSRSGEQHWAKLRTAWRAVKRFQGSHELSNILIPLATILSLTGSLKRLCAGEAKAIWQSREGNIWGWQ